MSADIARVKSTVEVVQANVNDYSSGLNRYLSALDLPTEKVLVSPRERMVVINNVPDIVALIDGQLRSRSMYISKFVAACGSGLFDAALNFLWNETIVSLRAKVSRFDLGYFLGSVVKDEKRRSTIRTEEDLSKLEDWELIRGCKETGIISEIAYKHLDFIRDMRNHASAAHPNHTELDGLQLSSWLQTCIKEVLAKEPEEPALQVKVLLHNVRTQAFNPTDIPPIESCLSKLPENVLLSLFRTMYGMYVDDRLSMAVRSNLRHLLPVLWSQLPEEERQEAGLKYAWFSVNGDLVKKGLGREVLDICGGLAYIPDDLKVAEMDQVIDALFDAHLGWNNFHNEPAHARNLRKLIPDSGRTPAELDRKLVKTVVMCKMGNGYGVSKAAEDYYDEILSLLDEHKIKQYVRLVADSDVQSRLQFAGCARRYKDMASLFATKVSDSSLSSALEMIGKCHDSALRNLSNDTRFRATYHAIAVK